MFNDTAESYQAATTDHGWVVLDAAGRVVVACADEPSAAQYATLLAEAYRRGYKAGYRDGRTP